MLKSVLLPCLLACALPALADSWDSDANINKAMDQAVSTFKAKGIPGLEEAARSCYAGMDYSRRNVNVGRDVEYCVSYELASTIIDRDNAKATNGARSAYFKDVLLRSAHNLEKARAVKLPEEIERYLAPRYQKIERAMPGKM